MVWYDNGRARGPEYHRGYQEATRSGPGDVVETEHSSTDRRLCNDSTVCMYTVSFN